MVKVSIVVPVYNGEQYLCRCMASLVNQTLKDIEIILVDDGSTDSTPEMCDGYAKLYNFVKVIHKENGGLGYARNSGMEVATGEYITFCDSDDYVELNTYEKAYQKGEETNADIVRFDYHRELPSGERVTPNKRCPLEEGLYEDEKYKEFIVYPTYGLLPYQGAKDFLDCSAWSNLYKRELFVKHQIKFESEREVLSEDLLFNVDVLAKAKSCYVLEDKFYHYIVNDGSLTQKYRPERFTATVKIFHELLARSKKYGIYEQTRLRIARRFLALTRWCIKYELLLIKDKKVAKKNICDMVNNEYLNKVLWSYPIKQMPLKYKLTYYAIRRKNFLVLRLIKNKI